MIVGFFVENWPAVDMAVSCRAMLHDAIRWLITGARCRDSQRGRRLDQVVFSYALIIVIEVQLSVKSTSVEYSR